MMQKRKAKEARKAQIWVETVIYTIIGLSIIAILLSIVSPAIDKYKDKTIIDQTITVLNDLNSEILDVKYYGLGNRRPFEFRIKKGIITIDSQGDRIIYALEESRLEYSELGEEVRQGDITIKTEKRGRRFDITLTLAYDDVDISYNGRDEEKVLQPTSVPYKIFVENKGVVGEKIQVDIQ